MVDWSAMPREILLIIAYLIYKNNFRDYLRFGATCRSWLSVARERPKTLPPQTPWLMHLFSNKENLETGSRNHFCSVSRKNTVLNLLEAPDLLSYHCCGASHGWLLMSMTDPVRHILINPITRATIQLPTTASPYSWNIRKMVLSSHPTLSDNCIIMVNGANQLAFCKLGDTSWTVVKVYDNFYTDDLTYYDGQFYVVDSKGRLSVVCDLGTTPKLKIINSSKELSEGLPWHCLVEITGKLFLVIRWLREQLPCISFEIFKLDRTTYQWSKVKSLHNYALFLSFGPSVSSLASDCPGFKRNCIYHNIYFKCGAQNLEDGSFESPSLYDYKNGNIWWITPSLW